MGLMGRTGQHGVLYRHLLYEAHKTCKTHKPPSRQLLTKLSNNPSSMTIS